MRGPFGGPLPALTEAEVARFRSKVDTSGTCHVWIGETNNNGYGRFAIYRRDNRIRVLAHRLAYKLDRGADPVGVVLRHTCDNPPCCNPAHLTVGDQLANVHDAMTRGRMNISGLEESRARRDARVAEMLAKGIRECGRCHEVKPLEEFVRSPRNLGGRKYVCKPCNREYQKMWNIRRGLPSDRTAA